MKEESILRSSLIIEEFVWYIQINGEFLLSYHQTWWTLFTFINLFLFIHDHIIWLLIWFYQTGRTELLCATWTILDTSFAGEMFATLTFKRIELVRCNHYGHIVSQLGHLFGQLGDIGFELSFCCSLTSFCIGQPKPVCKFTALYLRISQE